ncbi:hypothetical protein TNCV_3176721 [Trichonephila clavipes]|nr:hypothetical protein TNCV_3176721 [Trichonephila clavipes]
MEGLEKKTLGCLKEHVTRADREALKGKRSLFKRWFSDFNFWQWMYRMSRAFGRCLLFILRWIMFDPSSFANPTPLAHADTSRDVLPRGGTSQRCSYESRVPA